MGKGSNQGHFFRGQVDKYTWVDIGSSYLPGEVIAAFLSAQTEEADQITHRRRQIWAFYHQALEPLEASGKLRRPVVPPECEQNAHMYYILLPRLTIRNRLIDDLRAAGINTVFHYVPLHDAPFGKERGRAVNDLPVTRMASDCLLRLPLWLGVEAHQQKIVDALAADLLHD